MRAMWTSICGFQVLLLAAPLITAIETFGELASRRFSLNETEIHKILIESTGCSTVTLVTGCESNAFISHTALRVAFKMLESITSGYAPILIRRRFRLKEIDDELNRVLALSNEGYKFRLYNGIYVQSEEPPRDLLENSAINSSNLEGIGTLEKINFRYTTPRIRKINSQISIATGIEDMLLNRTFKADDKVASVNAATFEGDWEKPFNPVYTRRREFRVNEHRRIAIQTMYSFNVTLPYLKHNLDHFEMLLLPLRQKIHQAVPKASKKISFMIVLPTSDYVRRRNDNLENDFWLQENWTELIKDAKDTLMEVQLPKFDISYNIDLVPTALKSLRLMALLEGHGTDFSKISNSSDLHLTNMLFESTIFLDEDGVSGHSPRNKWSNLGSPLDSNRGKPFFANHPFYFAILDEDHIYFTGQFADTFDRGDLYGFNKYE